MRKRVKGVVERRDVLLEHLDFAKLQDLEMLVVAGSQERTVDEYSRLLERASFKLVRVLPTTEPASILEAVPH